jgi:hypothetical protein
MSTSLYDSLIELDRPIGKNSMIDSKSLSKNLNHGSLQITVTPTGALCLPVHQRGLPANLNLPLCSLIVCVMWLALHTHYHRVDPETERASESFPLMIMSF